MARYRFHSKKFKRQIAQEFLAGATLYGLAKVHHLSRQLIRVTMPDSVPLTVIRGPPDFRVTMSPIWKLGVLLMSKSLARGMRLIRLQQAREGNAI
jgi:hypothetical protein